MTRMMSAARLRVKAVGQGKTVSRPSPETIIGQAYDALRRGERPWLDASMKRRLRDDYGMEFDGKVFLGEWVDDEFVSVSDLTSANASSTDRTTPAMPPDPFTASMKAS